MTIGQPAVTFIYPDPDGVTRSHDVTCYIDSLSIRHGRDDPNSQPDAGTMTIEISANDDLNPPLPVVDIGNNVQCNVRVGGPTGTAVARWGGRITDINQEWDDAGELTPNAGKMTVIAASQLALLGRRIVGDVPWSQELDGARISKILSAAGINWNPAVSDPGTVQILARDVDAQPALDLAQEVANDAGGVLWQTNNGQIRYADAIHRRGTVASLTLDACDILVTPTWTRTTAGLINSVSIGYGVAPPDGEQPRYTAKRQSSINKWDTWAISTATQLAAQADAVSMGELILARNSEPVWVMSALPVDVKSLSDADTLTLIRLEMHDLILLTGLPAAGGAPTSAYLWVEGWEETWAWGEHEYTLAVSGYCRSAPPPHWDDIDPALTWDAMTQTWDEVSCVGPIVPAGRWDDIPASLRWDRIPAATTWDTWTG